MACEITALEALAEVCRLESELDIATAALTETTNQLCEALTMIVFLRVLLPAWKSAPATKVAGLEAELQVSCEELARYTARQMQ